MTAASVPSIALSFAAQADALCRILGMPLWGDLRLISASARNWDPPQILLYATVDEAEELARRLGLELVRSTVHEDAVHCSWDGVVADTRLSVVTVELRRD